MSTTSNKADKILQHSLILCTSGLGEELTAGQQHYSHPTHFNNARKDETHINTEVCN